MRVRIASVLSSLLTTADLSVVDHRCYTSDLLLACVWKIKEWSFMVV